MSKKDKPLKLLPLLLTIAGFALLIWLIDSQASHHSDLVLPARELAVVNGITTKESYNQDSTVTSTWYILDLYGLSSEKKYRLVTPSNYGFLDLRDTVLTETLIRTIRRR